MKRRFFLGAASVLGVTALEATTGAIPAGLIVEKVLGLDADPLQTNGTGSADPFSYYDPVLAHRLIKGGFDNCLTFAENHNLIHIMQSAAFHSGMPLPELMALTYFESSMGQNLNVRAVDGSPTESAQGIVQATAEKFRDEVAFFLINAPEKQIAALMQCLDNPYDSDAQKLLNGTSHARVLINDMRDYSGQNAPQSPTAAQVIGQNKTLDANVLAGRDSPHASMILVGKGLMRIRGEHPHLANLFGGAEFRMLHMFGPDGTYQIMQANKFKPTMTMVQAFKDPGGATHSRDYILENNQIDGTQTVKDYVNRFRTQHDTVCKMLSDYCNVNSLQAAPLQNAALIPPPLPQASAQLSQPPLSKYAALSQVSKHGHEKHAHDAKEPHRAVTRRGLFHRKPKPA